MFGCVGRVEHHHILATVIIVGVGVRVMSQQVIEFQEPVHGEAACSSSLSQNNIPCAVRDNAYQGRLSAVEIVAVGINSRSLIPAIAITTPAEVEVEEIPIHVSVAHETVTATPLSTVHNGAIGSEVVAK